MITSYTLYGIPNCDSVKKASNWFEEHQLPYTFIDFKKTPPDTALIENWLTQIDWQSLVNRKGTTFKKLPIDQQILLDQRSAAGIELLCAYTSIIKRPVIHMNRQHQSTIVIGYQPEVYADWLTQA